MPDSIDEFLYDTSPHSEKSVLDYWQHPIQYLPHPRNPEFVSLGRDGKAGGVGVDADISSQNYLPGGWPTLWHFALHFGPKFFLVAIGIGVIRSKLYLREVTKQRQSGCDSIPYPLHAARFPTGHHEPSNWHRLPRREDRQGQNCFRDVRDVIPHLPAKSDILLFGVS